MGKWAFPLDSPPDSALSGSRAGTWKLIEWLHYPEQQFPHRLFPKTN